MIQEVYYKKNKMHIKGDDGTEIISNKISFTRAFQFAQLNDVIFHYTNLTTADAVQFSRHLQKEIGSCDNRNIYDFFLSINENIHLIINDIDLFSIESAKKTIQTIIEDHNNDVVLYNIEAYGTDPYIAQTVYEELKIAQRQNNTVEIKILLSIVDTDEYDLDTFIEAVKKLAPISKQKEDKKKKQIIKLKEKFNDEFGCSTQALDDYIEYLSTFGGDYTSYIADAFNKCFDALIDNEPFCDRDGLIEYLGDLEV